MFKKLSIFTSFVFACIALLPIEQNVWAEPATLEKLLAAKQTRDGLTLTVATGGCTKKSDFEITSQTIKKGRASIEVRRLTPDSCKGNFPDGTKLSFSWAELKVPKKTKLSIKNPIENRRKVSGQSTK